MKIRKYLFSPLGNFLIYLVVIFIFSYLYSLFPDQAFGGEKMSCVKYFYLSVVTITTLGYGDITPETDPLMLLTSTESLLGIFIFGLFLNSLWDKFVIAREEIETREQARFKSLERGALLNYHYQAISDVFDNYKKVVLQITQPPMGSFKDFSEEYEPDFLFSNLSGIFDQVTDSTLVARYGMQQQRILVYYKVEAEIINELLCLKAEWDLNHYPRLRNSINSFLLIRNRYNIKESMIQIAEGRVKFGDEPYKDMLSRDTAKYSSMPEGRGVGAVSETVNLYCSIRLQMECINRIESEFEAINQEKDRVD